MHNVSLSFFFLFGYEEKLVFVLKPILTLDCITIEVSYDECRGGVFIFSSLSDFLHLVKAQYMQFIMKHRFKAVRYRMNT